MEFVKVFSPNYLKTDYGNKYYFKEVSAEGETVAYGSTYEGAGIMPCYYRKDGKSHRIFCKSLDDAQRYLNYTSGPEIIVAAAGEYYPQFREIKFEAGNLEHTFNLLHAYTTPGTELYLNPYFKRCLLLLPRDVCIFNSVLAILVSSDSSYKIDNESNVFLVSSYKHTLLYTLCTLYRTEILKTRKE